MQKQRLRNAFPLIALLSLILFIGSLLGIEFAEFLEKRLPFPLLPSSLQRSNILRYLTGLICFVLSFFGLYTFVYFRPVRHLSVQTKQTISSRKYFLLLGAMILSAAIALLLRRFLFEFNDFGFNISSVGIHHIPVFSAVFLFILAGVFFIWYDYRGNDISQILLYCIYVIALCTAFFTGLTLDIFQGDHYHGTAYIESIYNVYHKTPYTAMTSGIYGHYGLFFAPFLHLFGPRAFVITGLIALLQSISVLLVIYCIHNLTQKHWVRILCVLASCMTIFSMRVKNYWQIQPHRIVFPLVVLAYVIHMAKTKQWTRKRILIGYVLCILACLWNTECGLFCSAAFALAVISHSLTLDTWHSPGMLQKYAIHFAAIVSVMLGAILIVNIYNFSCGYYTPIFLDFFFPLFSSEYVSDMLKVDVQPNLDAWIFVLLLFGLLLLIGLYFTTFFHANEDLANRKESNLAPVMIAVAILALGNYSYYANRAAYLNLDIIIPYACIGNCILIELFPGLSKSTSYTLHTATKTAIHYISIVIVSVLALQTVLFTPGLIMDKADAGHYSLDDHYAFCDLLETHIPRDTFAFGSGISVPYNELGWDTGCHYRDFPDLTIDGNAVFDQVVADVLSQDSFLVYHSSWAVVQGSTWHEKELVSKITALEPGFVLEKEFEVNGISLQYYVKKH